MTELFYDKYDGEMYFDIESCEFQDNAYDLVLKADYKGKTVGFMVSVPVVVRKSLFKVIKYVQPTAQLSFSTIGDESNAFICALEELLKPVYKSSKKFSDAVEVIDYSVLNREMYELDNDKIYLKIYNDEDQTDFDEDEKINLEMNFTFNLGTKRATLAEVREGYSADLVAVLMR